MNWSFNGIIEILTRHLSAETVENNQNFMRDIRYPSLCSNRVPLKYEYRELPLYKPARCDSDIGYIMIVLHF
jgi:hypothetical protein